MGAIKNSTCPLCGGAMGVGDEACPTCRATAQRQDYVRAINFADAQFAGWKATGVISAEQMQMVRDRLIALREGAGAQGEENQAIGPGAPLASPSTCWRCNRAVGRSYQYCNRCGGPLGEKADRLRYLAFTLALVEGASGKVMSLSQARACGVDVQAQITTLREEMERGQLRGEALEAERLAHPEAANIGAARDEQKTVPGNAPQEPGRVGPVRRSVLEILLDPRNIQWLLGSGGVLLVVGLVIWLASLGVFKNPLVVAACMGAGTIGLMGSGFATIKLTRHSLAGRAITLLACLAMPLNLWFYQKHGLVTLDGHLWLAALCCCVLYATAATVLEDAVFVYVLAAGVAMTGLLILADLHKVCEIASPSALLVMLGLIFLHAERAFAPGEGAFSRKRFGMACFWSAQVLLGAGLLLLLGAQLAAELYRWLPMVTSWLPGKSSIVTDHGQRVLAIALVVAGAYAYVYSDLVVRRVGVYIYLAAAALLWTEALVIDLAHLTVHPPVLIAALALTSLVVNALQSIGPARERLATAPRLTRPLAPLGIILVLVPVVMGTVLHLRATALGVYCGWTFTITWGFVGAVVIAAVCSRICAYLNQRRSSPLSAAYLAGSAAAVLVATAGALSLSNVPDGTAQTDLLMLIPLAFLLASRICDASLQRPRVAVAHAAAGLLVVSGACSALLPFLPVQAVGSIHASPPLATLLAEAAVFYFTAAILYGTVPAVYLATATASAAVWQVLGYWNINGEYYGAIFAALGLLLLITCRVIESQTERGVGSSIGLAAFRCAHALVSLPLVSAALMAMSRFAVGRADWTLAILLGFFTLLSLIAAGLVGQSGGRRWYCAAAVSQCVLTLVALERLSQLTAWQNVELFCVAVGLLLLAIGYTLWYREQDRQNDAASFCLLFGALLASLPLAIAAGIYRFGFEISLPNEFALATISILMFVSGFICRLRAPTLLGGSLLAMHLAMLLVSMGMKAQLALGIYLALGGAGIFALGILLSVYHDRLLAVPQRMKDHEGVFKILAWR